MVEEARNYPKKMWKKINRVLERDSAGKSIPGLDVNDKVVTEDGKLPEALNMHFVSVGLKHLSASKRNPFKYIK